MCYRRYFYFCPLQGVTSYLSYTQGALPWAKETIGPSARLCNVVGFPVLANIVPPCRYCY